MGYLISFVTGIVFTEFVGYWLHILLHSERLPVLSRAHMIHHLRDYAPGRPLHGDCYASSAVGRASFLGFGFEWMLPIILITVGTVAVLTLLEIQAPYQVMFIVTAMAWGYFMFGYMHEAMHIKNFWMLRWPVVGPWYRRARQLHDFHHLQLTDDGRMLLNYGICFFWFDRLLGSFSPQAKAFNPNGFKQALNRYKDLIQ